jgi:hypothetical protein
VAPVPESPDRAAQHPAPARRAARRAWSRAVIWAVIGHAIVLGLYFYFASAPATVPVRVST